MRPIQHQHTTQSVWHVSAPASALIMWVCLWVNLNTGLMDIKAATNAAGWLQAIRGVMPLVVLPTAFFFLIIRRKLILPWNGPSRLLLAYGAVAALATVFSPDIPWSLYWSTAFIGTILVAWNFLERREYLESSRQMLQITWVATFIVAAIIGYQAQSSIFGHTSTAYGTIDSDLQGLTRSSGVARWAAVPGLVCLVRAYHSRRVLYFPIYLAIAGVAFFIVYRMQSRGAVFGSIAALLFALVVGSRLRKFALPFAALALVVILILDPPATLSNQVGNYLARGQTTEQLHSMTGRTRVYQDGIDAFEDAPIFGRGQWADRLVIHQHVHNSYLQALMNAGVLGAVPYFASWIAGWILFLKLQKRRARISTEDRICLLEAGTVMMFFTVRAIPETTTASYSVDFLVMVAVYLYLEALTRSASRRSRRRVTLMLLNAPSKLPAAGMRQAG